MGANKPIDGPLSLRSDRQKTYQSTLAQAGANQRALELAIALRDSFLELDAYT
jgi:hypothetical protein